MAKEVFWCYGCDTAHKSVGIQKLSCVTWVGNRTANFTPTFLWDQMHDQATDWLKRPIGEAMFTKARRGDIIVAMAPELVFARPTDIDITLRMFAEKGLRLAFVDNRWGDLRKRKVQIECGKEILRVRRLGLAKKQTPTPLGWKVYHGEYIKDPVRRAIGALVSLMRGKYRLKYSEIATILRRSSNQMKLSQLHRGFVAGWPQTEPKSLPVIDGLPEPASYQQLLRRRIRNLLLTGWYSRREIAQAVKITTTRANVLVQKYASQGFVLKDLREKTVVYSWVSDPNVEQELIAQRRVAWRIERDQKRRKKLGLALASLEQALAQCPVQSLEAQACPSQEESSSQTHLSQSPDAEQTP